MKTNDEITVSEMVKRKEARLELAAEPQPSQAVLCTSIYMCVNTCFSKGSHASVFVQVLLLLQKEKEESAPEAQVKEENRENLKHCGHGQVLNGSNYTDPPTAHYLFPATPPPPPPYSFHLIPRCHMYLPAWVLSLSLSRSQRVTGTLQSQRLHRLSIPLQMKNKQTCITTWGGGAREKRLKKTNKKKL